MPLPSDSKQAAHEMQWLRELLHTREMRGALNTLIPEFLALWAGEHALKSRLARTLARSFQAGLDRRRAAPDGAEPRLGQLLPKILDGLMAALAQELGAASEVPAARKREWLADALSRWRSGAPGLLLTRLAEALHDVHAENPSALAEAVAPVIQKWIQATDFGVLRDLADDMVPEVQAFAEALNTTLWRYPGKLVLALSLLPDLFNAALILLKESVGRFNRAAPDLVADIALSLLRAINGKTLGATVDELTRLTHGVHMGSRLIGDPGRSQFYADASQLATDIFGRVDVQAYWRARVAAAEGKATWTRARLDACAERPEFVAEGIRSFAARRNPALRSGVGRLQAMDDLDDRELSESLDQGLGELDLQEIGELVNLTSVLVNRAVDLNPKQMRLLSQQLAAAVDVDDLAAAVQALTDLSGEALRPVWRSVLPALVREGCRILAPADNAHETEAGEARQALRDLILGEARRS